jgi:hypothetical protein
MFDNICYKFVPFMDKYCTARQATDDHIIWRMRSSCWINKGLTHKLRIRNIASPQRQWLSERNLMLFCTYIACLLKRPAQL